MKIFINYRRDDSAGYSGRLFDHLVAHFGAQNIFMDIDTIEPGEDFRKAIRNAVGTCDVVLVMIGKQWLSIQDGHGQRRLDDPGDWVRAEIANALANPRVLVIPVLVRDAKMPGAHELPDELKELCWRNAVELSDTRFQHDAGKIIEVIERIGIKTPGTPEGRQHKNGAAKYWGIALGLVGLGLIFGLVRYGTNTLEALRTPTPEVILTSTNVPPSTLTSTASSTAPQAIPTLTKVVSIETVATNSADWDGILSVRMPTLNEIRQDMLSIWEANLLSLGDMSSPDIRSFNGTAQKDKEYLWPIYWCAKDQTTLSSNLENITTVFTVNGETIPEKYIFDYYYDTNTEWKCNYRATVVGRWPNNTQLVLQVKRIFAAQINDGQQSYPAGDYVYELIITVK